MAKNEITGDSLRTKPASDNYRAGHDRIFKGVSMDSEQSANEYQFEEKERYADPVDAGCAAAEKWIAEKIEQQRRAFEAQDKSFDIGRCRNCSEKLDDSRNYCDEYCRNDHQMRIASDKRNGRKPIINEYGCENG